MQIDAYSLLSKVSQTNIERPALPAVQVAGLRRGKQVVHDIGILMIGDVIEPGTHSPPLPAECHFTLDVQVQFKERRKPERIEASHQVAEGILKVVWESRPVLGQI